MASSRVDMGMVLVRRASADRGTNSWIEAAAVRVARGIAQALDKARAEDTRSEAVVGGEDGDNLAMEVCLAKAVVAGGRTRDNRIVLGSEMDEAVATAAADAAVVAEASEVPLAARGRHCQTC